MILIIQIILIIIMIIILQIIILLIILITTIIIIIITTTNAFEDDDLKSSVKAELYIKLPHIRMKLCVSVCVPARLTWVRLSLRGEMGEVRVRMVWSVMFPH